MKATSMPKMQQSCDISIKFLREFGHTGAGKSICYKQPYIIKAHLFLGFLPNTTRFSVTSLINNSGNKPTRRGFFAFSIPSYISIYKKLQTLRPYTINAVVGNTQIF